MKKLFIFLALIVAFSAGAQKTIRYQLIDTDTLTNGDTISAVYPGIIDADMYYSVQLVCDSLTSALNGNCLLQQGNSVTPDKWTTLSTDTLALGTGGGTTFEILWEGGATPFLGSKLRVYIISTGTGTDVCNAYLVLKRKNQ